MITVTADRNFQYWKPCDGMIITVIITVTVTSVIVNTTLSMITVVTNRRQQFRYGKPMNKSYIIGKGTC